MILNLGNCVSFIVSVEWFKKSKFICYFMFEPPFAEHKDITINGKIRDFYRN